MRGLTIVIVDDSSERFRTMLSMAAAHVALDGAARLFLSGDAVRLVREPLISCDDDRHLATGQPDLASVFADALLLGVDIIVCQTGMALNALTMADFDARVQSGGMVSLLASLRDDRLLTG